MKGLDIYLSTLNKEEYDVVSAKISGIHKGITPLMSWDIYSDQYFRSLNEAERIQDINQVKSYAKKYNWQDNVESIFEKEVFEAIILTDLSQNIVWVNKGFSKMTGYAKSDVLNKRPGLLQGANTSRTAKSKIRSKLRGSMPFKEIITNYRKNGDPYECEIKIYPLFSNNNKTHFIALERQVG